MGKMIKDVFDIMIITITNLANQTHIFTIFRFCVFFEVVVFQCPTMIDRGSNMGQVNKT